MNVELVTAYLCLGSNMGDRHENIDKALEYISQKLRVTEKSSVYDTEPVGNPEQPRFLNMVCQIKTMLKAADHVSNRVREERDWERIRGATTNFEYGDED